MIGTHLSHYLIEAELGRGGMGIVYEATDTKLNRKVAIKVLPASALASEDDRARFFREAQAAAQLSHPNVCHVYQVDEAIPIEHGKEPQPGAEKRLFIAMEFIEGETLQDYIKKNPLKLTEAVQVAAQVADALKAAHAKEIVHRDIKSANVMLTEDGTAKVLDFGLAKTNQSTMLTKMGSTLGTVNYMSPEQARGQEVDSRTDLYSLGAMLYEMIAGRLPFAGEYEQAVVYSILNENPEPLTSVRTGVPMQLEWIVNKLLAKEADYRYQTAADLLADLKTVDVGGSGHSRRSMSAAPTATSLSGTAAGIPGSTFASDGSLAATQEAPKSFKTVPAAVWAIVAAVLFAGFAAGYVFKPEAAPVPEPIRQFTINKSHIDFIGQPAGSSDGRYWAYYKWTSSEEGTMLWDVQSNSERFIPGSAGTRDLQFSPDGSWLGMYSNAGRLMRARIPSGRTLFVDSLRNYVWLDNEHLVVGPDDSLAMYALSVEDRVRISINIDAVDTAYVDFGDWTRVGDTSIILVTAEREDESVDLLSVDIESGKVKTLMPGACCALPVGEHSILYLTSLDPDARGGQLVAQRFDSKTGHLFGTPIDLNDEIIAPYQIGVGGDDTFFLLPRQTVTRGDRRLSWIDPESGITELLQLPTASYDRFSFSPTGSQIAIERSGTGGINSGQNIFLIDLDTQTEQRLTYTVNVNRVPVWTSSGKIFFTGGPPQNSSIYVKNADGTGSETMLVDDGDFPTVSADEEWLVYVRQTNAGDLIALNLDTGLSVNIDTSAMRTNDPAISPNGKYIAFSGSPDTDNTIGSRQRLYVRSFPDPDRLFLQVVEGAADDPFWSLDGKYLYYKDLSKLWRIGVDSGDSFRPVSAPELITDLAGAGNMRLGFHPADGRILAVHNEALIGATSNGLDIQVMLSFSRYLDQLFGSED